MFYKRLQSVLLMTVLFGAEAGAVSLGLDEQLDVAGPAPEQGTLLVAQGASTGESTMGVLHIPLDDEVLSGEKALDEGQGGAVDSLGFARVPLPAAAWLFGTAVVGIIAVSRRRPERQLG